MLICCLIPNSLNAKEFHLVILFFELSRRYLRRHWSVVSENKFRSVRPAQNTNEESFNWTQCTRIRVSGNSRKRGLIVFICHIKAITVPLLFGSSFPEHSAETLRRWQKGQPPQTQQLHNTKLKRHRRQAACVSFNVKQKAALTKQAIPLRMQMGDVHPRSRVIEHYPCYQSAISNAFPKQRFLLLLPALATFFPLLQSVVSEIATRNLSWSNTFWVSMAFFFEKKYALKNRFVICTSLPTEIYTKTCKQALVRKCLINFNFLQVS